MESAERNPTVIQSKCFAKIGKGRGAAYGESGSLAEQVELSLNSDN